MGVASHIVRTKFRTPRNNRWLIKRISDSFYALNDEDRAYVVTWLARWHDEIQRYCRE